MAIVNKKPVTPAQRGMTTADRSEVTAKKPIKALLVPNKRHAGRNNQGRITVRHRGGGAKRFIRKISFTVEDGLKATVEAIEYDPNRSANIARLKREDNGRYMYVVAASGLKVGQKVLASPEAAVEPGNIMPLSAIPLGTVINNIELKPGAGAQLARGAGAAAQLVAKDEKYAQVKLPSSEVRLIDIRCRATIGSVGNEQHQNIKLGSAGRKRRMGRRPQVRGLAMNAVDHPHGGGDGGSSRIGKDPRTPWGRPTLGYKTRRRKSTAKYIVKSRHESKR